MVKWNEKNNNKKEKQEQELRKKEGGGGEICWKKWSWLYGLPWKVSGKAMTNDAKGRGGD